MKAAPSAIRRPRDKRDNQLFGLLFTLPFILGFVFIFLYIFITAIRFSVSDMSLGQNGFELSFVWLENFRYALRGDPNYVRILLDALKNMLTTIAVVLILGLSVMCAIQTALSAAYFVSERHTALTAILDGAGAMSQRFAELGDIVTQPLADERPQVGVGEHLFPAHVADRRRVGGLGRAVQPVGFHLGTGVGLVDAAAGHGRCGQYDNKLFHLVTLSRF